MSNFLQPSVYIVILNYNGIKDTIDCLESLKRITYPNYKVVVVDNGSTGNDVEILSKRFGDFVNIVSLDKNYGVGKGFNEGIRFALAREAEYVLLMHNDVVVSPNFLDELVKVARSNPKFGILGPIIYFYNEPKKIWHASHSVNLWTGTSHFRFVGELDRGQVKGVQPVQILMTACMLIRRQVLDEVGLLDERFLVGWEEDDICLRAWSKGYKVILVPSSRVWHKLGRTTKKLKGDRSFYYQQALAYFLFLKKHCKIPQLISSILYRFLVHRKIFTIAPSSAQTLTSYFKATIAFLKIILRDRCPQ